MLKSPSRNQRSKGIKAKHVLYVCLLLALCFWLIYQVKHSYDQKKEFDENDAKFSLNTRSGNEIIRLGRKDLYPRVKETATENEKHDEEAEEEVTAGEDEESKHEEEQEKDENTEGKEDEMRVDLEDEIDEHGQEKSDADVDREEDFIDEEKEREEGEDEDGKESEEKDTEDEDGQMGNEVSLEDNDHEDSARNTHEAREENYKADDASSAVTHDAQTITTENENGSSENSNDHTQTNTSEQENEVNNEEANVGQNKTALMVEDGEILENDSPLNGAANEEKVSGSVLFKLEDSPTTKTEANDQPQLSNNSTEASTETRGLSLPNGTETISDFPQAQNATVGDTTSLGGSNLKTIALEQANTDTLTTDNNQSDSNATISTKPEDTEATRRESSEFVATEMVIKPNASAEAEDSSGSSMTEDATQNEKSGTSNDTENTDENSGASETENAEVQHDPMDSSDPSIPVEETGSGSH